MNPEPYVGPRSFTVDDGDRFFGRKDEVDEVVSLVMAHPVVIIYALSGVGKSSLISAGVVPMLRKEGFAALPPARVEGVIPTGIEANEITNRYVFQALSCWLDQQEVPFCAAEEVTGMSVSQFVEAWMASRPEELEDAAPVLVFDQFEEIFTGAESRWNEREEFFTQLGAALAAHRRLKIVFALREEFVARLEPFSKKFPRALRTRKRLERLRAPAALLAITRPAEKFGLSYESGVAEKLVQDLLGSGDDDGCGATVGEFVEPVQLQVVCRNLWEKLPAELKQPGATGEPRHITHEHLQAAGEVTTALANYYDEAIRAAVAASGMRERRLRLWFGETLVGSDGSSLGMAVKGQAETNAIPLEAIRALREKYLIRHEKRGIAEWYELAHARFIQPILNSNETWLGARRESEILRKKFLQRAAELNQGDRLLDDRRELEEVEAFLSSVDPQERSDFEPLQKLAKRSRQEIDRVTEEREREALRQEEVNNLRIKIIRLGKVLVAGLSVLVVAAGFGFWQAEQSAKAAAESATKAKDSALTARAQALAIRAGAVIPADPECGILLAIHAMDSKETAEGVATLRRALIASQIRLLMAAPQGHTGSVMAVAYTPDGTEILTGGVDGKVRIWNPRTASLLGFLGGEPGTWHGGFVWSIAFHPSGSLVATAGADGNLRLWPYPAPAGSEWRPVAVFSHLTKEGKPATVQSVTFDPEGARVLACCQDGTAHVWDVAAKQELVRLVGHEGFVRGGAFHPTQRNLVVTAGQDNRARIWDLDTPSTPDPSRPDAAPSISPLGALIPPSDEDQGLWDARFNADGTWVVTAGADHVARIWDFQTRAVLANLDGHDGPVVLAKFIDERRVITTSVDKTARLWKLDFLVMPGKALLPTTEPLLTIPPIPTRFLAAREEAVFRGHTDIVRNVALSPDLRYLTTSSKDGTARIWEMPPGFEVALLPEKFIIREAAFRPGRRELVTAAGLSATVWELGHGSLGRARVTLTGHTDIVRSIAYRPDGKRLATASDDGSARIWDAETGTQLGALPGGPHGPLYSVAFDPSGRYVAVGGKLKIAAVWDTETDTVVPMENVTESVQGVSFNHDGTRVAGVGYEQTARVWDRATGKSLFTSARQDDVVLDADFSPDGKWLVTAGGDGTARILDAATGTQLTVLKKHEGQVRKARFIQFAPSAGENPAGGKTRTVLLTAGFDHAVRVWEQNPTTKKWEETQELTGAAGPVYAIAASQDGTEIVTGGADQWGRVYYLDPHSLWNLARTRVTRKFSPDEREEYGISDDE